MGKLSVLSEEGEFSVLQFEKTLTNLKDSQDCINQCCQWCLANRQHYKKIVNSWLNVIKRVKVEQRLTLFYLANDVVQYSKRKNYEFVDIWGTAIQKATTMVRDDKVKHKILRIFKIWEQRGVYGEEFITDLCGLISVQPAGSKNDEPHEFQSSYVINKIKYCASLENDTDAKLKILKEHNPKIQITEGLVNSLKDRAHVDDVEKELDVYVEHTEKYISALQIEIKNRIALISVLKQAETQLECDRKDVKTVANAYKNFGIHMSHVKKKLAEKLPTLTSPVPSPDINAPSPSPEDGIDLPDDDLINSAKSAVIQFPSPAFYVPPSSANYNSNYNNSTFTSNNNSSTIGADASFISNGFSSFMGQNLGFDISNIGASGLFSNSTSENARSTLPIVDQSAPVSADLNNPAPYNPLLPPPQPPFSKNSDSGFNFNASMDMILDPNYPGPDYNYGNSYNTQTVETWDNAENPVWNEVKTGVKASRSPEDDSLSDAGGHDVDHRNLISLTGSPNEDSAVNGRDERKSSNKRGNLKSITPQDRSWNSGDQDYRSFLATSGNKGKGHNSSSSSAAASRHQDRDYRIQFNLSAPSPPPPPKLKKRTSHSSSTKSPRKYEDDFSHDSNDYTDTHSSSLEPPPPLPDLLDDVDANQFLDEIANEIGDFSNLSGEMVNNDVAENDGDSNKIHANGKQPKLWKPLQPPPMAFNLGGNPNNSHMGYPEGNFMFNRNPLLPPAPGSGLLPTPKIDPSYSANWMADGQSSAALWSEENQFNNIDESSNNNYERSGFNNFRGNSHTGGGFRNNRGNNRANNNNNNNRGSWSDRGRGRGGDRQNGRGKGNGHFRSRGNFRGNSYSKGGY